MRLESRNTNLFRLINNIVLSFIALFCLMPLVHMFAVSFSSRAAATANIVDFWPIGWTADAYTTTMRNHNFLGSLWISVERTVLGTFLSMAVVAMAAYSLSRSNKAFPGRSWYTGFFIFAMLFNGGLIPTYIVIGKLHMMNTIWALVLPMAVNVWNLILMVNFIRGLPSEMEEAAFIDGAGHFNQLWLIILPVSMPAIATLSLFTMVIQWNTWFDGVIYMNNLQDYPLASFLHTIIINENFTQIGVTANDVANISNRTVKAAQLFIAALPIMLVYPFLQKYFVKGVVMGAVKE